MTACCLCRRQPRQPRGGRLFRDLLWPYRDELTGADPKATIDMTYRLVYAACTHRVLHGPNLESPTPVA
jgi:hypothetical protein